MISKKPEVLLIQPPFIRFFAREYYGIPLGLCYISGVLNNNDIHTRIFDAEFDPSTGFISKAWPTTKIQKQNILDEILKEVKEIVKKTSPNVVGLSMLTYNFNFTCKIAQMIKEMDDSITTIVGGVHPTNNPYEVVNFPYFDFVVRGEGENTFHELLIAMQNGEDYKNIDGLVYKEDDKLVVTKPRTFIQDLDSIPFPDRKSLINAKKFPPFAFGSIITSRGCPFKCAFCDSHTMWTRKMRLRSIDNVLDEIEIVIKDFGTREFNLYDDTFNVNPVRVEKFCNGVKERNIDFVWACNSRVDTISNNHMYNKNIPKMMKSAGCIRVRFGVESGNESMLNKMKKDTTLNQVRKAVAICNEAGIETFAWFVLGYPGETKESMEDTFNLIKELNLNVASFSIAQPLPGTELYNVAFNEGMMKNEKWWRSKNYFDDEPLIELDSMSQEELVAYYNRFKVEFNNLWLKTVKKRLLNAKYLYLKMLENTRSPFIMLDYSRKLLQIVKNK